MLFETGLQRLNNRLRYRDDTRKLLFESIERQNALPLSPHDGHFQSFDGIVLFTSRQWLNTQQPFGKQSNYVKYRIMQISYWK